MVEKDTSAVAHKLNGQIFEKLKQPEKVLLAMLLRLVGINLFQALGCYKRSYELEPSNDLVLKICGIMTTLPIEPGRAKYWVEVSDFVGDVSEDANAIIQVGEKAVPHSDVVYKLREVMLTASEGENSPALEDVLLQELKARPTDVQLRVRYLSLKILFLMITLQVRLVTLYHRTGRISDGWQNF